MIQKSSQDIHALLKTQQRDRKQTSLPHTCRYTILAGMFYMVALWHKQLCLL